MTAAGFRKHDATGRSTGKLKQNRHTKIQGQFIAHLVEMLESPAWRALSLNERRALDRLEIEHCGHAGTENGSLPCTYDDFAEFGIRRKSIANVLLKLSTLGFVRITERGTRAYADISGKASRYRLTYLPPRGEAPTDEWRRLESADAVRDALDAARTEHDRWLDTAPDSPRRRELKRLEQKARGKVSPQPGAPTPLNVGQARGA